MTKFYYPSTTLFINSNVLHYSSVKNVFLNSVLDKEIHMEQLPDFITQRESRKVCRLKKSLYGSKQSPRA